MTAYTATITSTLGLFGLAPTTKWNAFNWGSAKWGEGTLVQTYVIGKSYTESEVLTSTVGPFSISHLVPLGTFVAGDTFVKGMIHSMSFGSFVATDDITKSQVKIVEDSFSQTSVVLHDYLGTGNGYYYVFPSQITDIASRANPTYAEGSNSSLSYTCLAANSTTWVEE